MNFHEERFSELFHRSTTGNSSLAPQDPESPSLVSNETQLGVTLPVLELSAKYASVDKDHSYLTTPKVVMVSPAAGSDKRKKGQTPIKKKPATTTPSKSSEASKKTQRSSLKTNGATSDDGKGLLCT